MTRLLRLFTRRGCHLCAEAEKVLARLVTDAGAASALSLEVIDIDAEPAITDRYTVRVPVVELDGVEVAELQVDETALRLALGVGR